MPVNVTSQLRAVSDYTALEAQRPNTVQYLWTHYVEFDVAPLIIREGDAPFESSFMFRSVGAGPNTVYIGGYYNFESTADNFNPSVTCGTINLSYAGHIGFVADTPPAGSTTIQVSGTSITDAGVRAVTSEDVVFTPSDPINTWKETTKKWLGQVTIEKTAGDDRLCNYGYVKYWDFANRDFTLQGFEFTWFGGGNDSGADLIVYHHKATGWTYNAGAPPDPPVFAQMSVTHGAERQVGLDTPGAFKRTGLDQPVAGAAEEGLIAAAIQTTGIPFDSGTLKYTVY